MKKFLITALFALIGAFAFSQERIAVLSFEDREEILTRNEMDFFYQDFINEFRNRSPRVVSITPREDLARLIGVEMDFQLSEFAAREKTAAMNSVLSGTQILSGRIGRVGNNIRITVSIYSYPDLDVQYGGATRSVSNKEALFTIIPELVGEIQNEIAGRGSRVGAIPANFVHVEGGTFTMGSPQGNWRVDRNETPQHQVMVSSFYMSRHEVTRAEWQEVMGRRSIPGGDNLPVIVSWYDAIDYCNRRSLREGLTPVYRGSGDNITADWNANGYRLPTEAEWEYAAKGGNKDLLIFTYSGSNNAATVAWYSDYGKKYNVQPVGIKLPNSLGIYDMSGNAREWCWDLYGDYTDIPKFNPRGASTGNEYNSRVVRGGGVESSLREITNTSRSWFPYPFQSAAGIRLVRGIPGTGSR